MGVLDLYNTYAWPNRDSYRTMGVDKMGLGTGGLRHGCLVSVDRLAISGVGSGLGDWQAKVNYALVKRFQFNPPEMRFDVGNSGAAPGVTEAAGGNANGFVLGQLTSSLSLTFNRELEVFRAANNASGTPAEFARYGVMLDILDVFKVLLGASQVRELADQPINETVAVDLTNIRDSGFVSSSSGKLLSSINSMNKYIFDTATAGAEGLVSRPVAIVFNSDLAMYGYVMRIAYDFQKFSKNLVPTVASIALDIQIQRTGTAAQISGPMISAQNAQGYTNYIGPGGLGGWGAPVATVGTPASGGGGRPPMAI